MEYKLNDLIIENFGLSVFLGAMVTISFMQLVWWARGAWDRTRKVDYLPCEGHGARLAKIDLEMVKLPCVTHTYKLDELKNRDEQTDKTIMKMENSMDLMKTDIKLLQSDMEVVKSDIKILKNDMGVVKEDIKVMKDDIKVMKVDIQTTKEDIRSMKTDITNIYTSMDNINSCIANINNNLFGLPAGGNYTRKNSPVSLSPEGEKVMNELKIKEILDRNWNRIRNYLDENSKSDNPYDIHQCCETQIIRCPEIFLDTEDIDKIKLRAYQDGNHLVQYTDAIAIMVRDRYLGERGISVTGNENTPEDPE